MLKIKNAVKIITISVILFCTSMLLYTNIIQTIQKNHETYINNFEENQFNNIWLYLELLKQQSEDEVTLLSQNIERDLLSLSEEELKQIQDDMTNNIHNEMLHNIIMNNTSRHDLNNIDNKRNGIIICTMDGFIEDINYRRASQFNDNKNTFRDWEYTINNSYNKELDQNAIGKLIHRTSGIIALESYDIINDPNHKIISELTYNSLLEVYKAEGLEGLRNYQFLVPYYITDIGDIFGNPDIIQGSINKNNKIIVIQEFNLYDQIIGNESKIFDNTNSQLDTYTKETERLLNSLRIFGIGLIFGVFGFILFCGEIYNNIIISEEEKEGKLNTENEEE